MDFDIEKIAVNAPSKTVTFKTRYGPVSYGVNIGKSAMMEEIVKSVNRTCNEMDEIIKKLQDEERAKNPTIAVHILESDEKLIHFAGRYHKVKK